jgi:coenzyme F420-dependent glucose-6-phosphate dehydrogenase
MLHTQRCEAVGLLLRKGRCRAEIGYKLCSEENSAQALVNHARRAEEAGFTFAAISDHYHPWTRKQGHSPFVWAALGAISTATTRLQLITGVTCPIQRIHPAIIAQASATVATLLPGQFSLGLGTGEKLNEHILGDRWPPAEIRQPMLKEAVEIIRALWSGEETDHHGHYFTVENAQLFEVPSELPPICIAAGGPKSATLAGEIGDGLVSTAPDKGIVAAFEKAGGSGPAYAELSVCYASSEKEALQNAFEAWPNVGISGELTQQLPVPAHFEQAAKMVSEDDVAEKVVCGPDPERHVAGIRKYLDAGFDHIAVHQIGNDQQQTEFFEFYKEEVLPKI